ncbi:MAG TPA: 7-cyano-7-deazaguanine synthase QueC [Phycisphaerales bacterium]
MSSPSVVLLSGGLDSATALAVARRDGFRCVTLAIDYGQRHRVELAAAALVSRQLGAAEHRVVPIDLRAIGGSALTADIDVPKDRSDAAITHGVPITYVPARNLTFLSIAAGLAEVVHARDIYVGTNAVDYSGYPDCRRPFIDAFAAAANLGTKAGSESREPWLRVRTPLSELSKAAIIRLGVSLGVDYALTTSCYDPTTDSNNKPLACGRCDSCQIRRRGFEEAGVPDPTRYAA